jgi:hypothetical protein
MHRQSGNLLNERLLSPDVKSLGLNANEDFVEVPLVSRVWPAPMQMVGKGLAKFLTPASHRSVGDGSAPLRHLFVFAGYRF